MIVVKVELHSAVTHKVTELARAVIYNDGGTSTRGDYVAFSCRGRDTVALEGSMRSVLRGETQPVHSGRVDNHARLNEHVWNLVAKALVAMGYGKDQ